MPVIMWLAMPVRRRRLCTWLISKYILVSTLRKLAEALNLKAKTVGDIAGYATSVPELLTITTSSLRGLTGASVYNILSSNVIN